MRAITRSKTSRNLDRRPDDGTVTEYLGFRVGGDDYALPVAVVREIVRSGHLTPVPRAPPGVLGVSNFRGRVVTIIDLGNRLGQSLPIVAPLVGPTRFQRLRILMIDVGQETLGYLVEEVHQVYRFSTRDIERATTVGTDVGMHVSGIARPQEGGEVVIILDPKALVPT